MNKYTIKKGDKTVTIKELKERIDYNMDVKEALKLTPKRLFSPITGSWIDLECDPLGETPWFKQMGYEISCSENTIALSGKFECRKYDMSREFTNDIGYFDKYLFWENIEKKKKNDKLVLKFEIATTVHTNIDRINRERCGKCQYLEQCKLIEKVEKNEVRGKLFDSFDLDLEYELELEFENKKLKPKKERTITNYLKMKVEFGQNKDLNLRSTTEGIAVKSNDGWNVFAPNGNTIINVKEIPDKDIFPIFIMPTSKLEVGDLIKDTWDTGEYYYVIEVYESNLMTVAAKDGKVKLIKPFRDARDNKYYVKLTSFMDFLDIEGDSNMMKLMMFYLLKDKK